MQLMLSKPLRGVGLGFSLALFGLACLQSPGQTRKTATGPSFAHDVLPEVKRFCAPCHSGNEPAAGLDLTKYSTVEAIQKDPDVWQKVVKRVSAGQMPPEGAAQPKSTQRAALLQWVETTLSNQCRLADPGRVTIRRLNRAEYNNTIRDLVGLDLRPADDFPSDDVGNGFDNMGDVLSISPLLMENYLTAAEKVARATIAVPGVRTRHIEALDMSESKQVLPEEAGTRGFFTNSEIFKDISLTLAGRYRVRARAYGDQAGNEAPKLLIKIDGQPVATYEVVAHKARPEDYEVPVRIEGGKHRISASYINDFYDAKLPAGHQDRNLHLFSIELTGPLDANEPLPESHLRIIPHQPDFADEEATARQDLGAFATRAFRRPVRPDELDRLMKVYAVGRKTGGRFEEGMRLGMEAILASPNFLFRVELDPKGNGKSRSLNDYELASRLSYFLWSSMPDGELFAAAQTGKLHQTATLEHEIRRMLVDPKAHALADDFAGQWLQLRKLAIVNPDPARFPGINDALKGDLATETKSFFMNVVREDCSVIDFIDGKYTFLNERLARHYGIDGITGNDFQKVALKDDRGGVITQGSVLLVTSNPTRTSPTKRGKWVLENILGTPPPPPPPGVAQIKEEQHQISAGTLRQLMEQHRKNPTCASCHSRMDPIGFGLENYDPVGRWRTQEGNQVIDTSGTLPDGRTFRGPGQLKKILLSQKPLFVRTLAEKLLTYGLGRGLESSDHCSVDAIAQTVKEHQYKFSALVTAVVESEPFRKRKGG